MTKNEIINNLYLSKPFNTCISRMEPSHLRRDLKNEVVLILLEQPEERIIDLHETKKLDCFAKNIAYNLIKFNSGKFYQHYKLKTTDIIPEIQYEEMNGRVKREEIEEPVFSLLIELKSLAGSKSFSWIEKLRVVFSPYEQNIISLYMKLGSYRRIEEQTGIPWESCYKTVRKAITVLKQKYATVEL